MVRYQGPVEKLEVNQSLIAYTLKHEVFLFEVVELKQTLMLK